mgnify:CR=1 FL=1
MGSKQCGAGGVQAASRCGGKRRQVLGDCRVATLLIPLWLMQIIDYDKLDIIAAERREDFLDAAPYAHIVLDDFLESEAAESLLEEFGDADKWSHYNHYNERKMGLTRFDEFGERTQAIVSELSSPRFLEFLQGMSGIDDLLADPDLDGGGLHQILPSGYLNVHADFQSHTTRPSWSRQLNMLIYLNKDWQDEWGGFLELWAEDMTEAVESVRPDFNRCVIFHTTTASMHGHPTPLACPAGNSRKSLALYYFRDERVVQKLAPTDYRARPVDPVAKHALIAVDRWLVRAYSLLKRHNLLGDRAVSRILKLFSR